VLELPATGWLRRYRVRAHGRVRQDALDRLHRGISIDGVRYGAIEARLDREQGTNVWLTFAMREGKNREVKNVLGHLGLKVNRLIRVSFGPFQLGDLAEGSIEEVRTRHLREQLGARVMALADADFASPILPHADEGHPPPAKRSGAGKVGERQRAGAKGSSAARLAPDPSPALAKARGGREAPRRQSRPDPQDDAPESRRKRAGKRRHDAERFGEPALARHERRNRRHRGRDGG
jgi:23S rRNA pseudouridine2605 synthase